MSFPVSPAPPAEQASRAAPVLTVLPGGLALPRGRPGSGLPDAYSRRMPDERLFVGRQAELDVLAGEMSAAERGCARLVVIEGEQGMGKSALIAEFLARQRRAALMTASGEESEQALPYGLVRQLTGWLADGLPADCPALAAGPAADVDPLAAGAELQALLSARQDAGAAIVIIEDLQWADRPSSCALLYACRRLTRGRILVIVSGRPAGLRALGTGWARFLQTGGGCRNLALGPLDSSELAALAVAVGRSALPGRALRQVADCSEGSPVLALALLTELPDHVLSGPPSEITAPRSVLAVVAPRLAALRADARDLVIAAAVLGERCALSDAALLAGVPLADDALDLAAQAGFLVAEPAHRQVRFAQELIRRAVYADIGAAMRRSLHRWAATLTDGPDALGHRAAAACGPDLRLAAELDAAADAAAADAAAGRGAPGRAARYLRQAAELGARGPERASRILAAFELLVRAADAAAAESLRPLAEQLPASIRRDAGLGQLALLTARPADAHALLAAAWDRHQQAAWPRDEAAAELAADHAAAAEAAAALSVLHGSIGSFAEAGTWAARSVVAAAGDQRHQPGLLAMQAMAYLQAGPASQGSPAGQGSPAAQLLSCLPAAPAMVPAACCDALTARGVLRLRAGEVRAAADDLSAVVTRICAGLPVRLPGQAAGYLAAAWFGLGSWDEAGELAGLAVSMARDAGRHDDLPLAHHAATLVPALRGDWELAGAHALAAQQAARACGTEAAAVHAAAARCALGFARSDPAEVLAATAQLTSMPGIEGHDDPATRLWRPIRIWALISTGQLGQAEHALDELDARLAAGDGSALVHCAWLRASLALASNAPAAAERVLQACSTLAASVPDPLARGLFEVEFARCLARLRKRPAALTRLRAGHDILSTLRARPLAQAAAAELEGLGMAPRPDAEHCLAGLTPQELQVARLVGGGMSNREAAAALYLSPKTIEYHMAHIFAKLGIRTRYQLAARLRQRAAGSVRPAMASQAAPSAR